MLKINFYHVIVVLLYVENKETQWIEPALPVQGCFYF